ncbi:hypothetical protein VUJ46_17380 [Chryseobacterium sp. MYb264]|uniref:hypothetical protein n=1 Tax=Chryseobacterium sp. MYb264 TaxID=2745153 RepID=UPI002E113FB7|nr:hypothetical protein VUJ46_17380 [Chryseobacterium sp. MYb264]
MMRPFVKIWALALCTFIITSCSNDNKRRGVDYTKFKSEITLTPEQEKSYDEITIRYQKQAEQNFEVAKAQGGQMDRVALGVKSEELRARQAEEMAKVLDNDQMEKFNKFVDENARKRPRYNNEILAKLKTELQLSEDQFAMLNAANDAFEKSFNDAHDVYHGNNELAKEYWEKFDKQRKEALQKVFTPDQNTRFLEIVKDQQFKGRK